MSTFKTNIPHTFLVSYQSEDTIHRGVMLVSYCKNGLDAIEKVKSILKETYKRANQYFYQAN